MLYIIAAGLSIKGIPSFIVKASTTTYELSALAKQVTHFETTIQRLATELDLSQLEHDLRHLQQRLQRLNKLPRLLVALLWPAYGARLRRRVKHIYRLLQLSLVPTSQQRLALTSPIADAEQRPGADRTIMSTSTPDHAPDTVGGAQLDCSNSSPTNYNTAETTKVRLGRIETTLDGQTHALDRVYEILIDITHDTTCLMHRTAEATLSTISATPSDHSLRPTSYPGLESPPSNESRHRQFDDHGSPVRSVSDGAQDLAFVGAVFLDP
ncbi:Hypothetical protein D9617_14g075960 [Elsinoe fawcettii]|nr:Hypothetical protein D9617_14g075960 [Elsinoe fawcettii]